MKGLEPSTFCMASRRSSQLSYIRKVGEEYSPALGGLSLEAERHHQLGSEAAVAVLDLEAVGEVGDQREAETEAGAVGPGRHALALVADLDDDLAVLDLGVDDQRADVAGGIRVDDDIGACLAHCQGKIGLDIIVDVVSSRELDDRVAQGRDVLGDGWNRTAERAGGSRLLGPHESLTARR